jgi:hypothetical protein
MDAFHSLPPLLSLSRCCWDAETERDRYTVNELAGAIAMVPHLHRPVKTNVRLFSDAFLFLSRLTNTSRVTFTDVVVFPHCGHFYSP